jgi:hypothetical protein
VLLVLRTSSRIIEEEAILPESCRCCCGCGCCCFVDAADELPLEEDVAEAGDMVLPPSFCFTVASPLLPPLLPPDCCCCCSPNFAGGPRSVGAGCNEGDEMPLTMPGREAADAEVAASERGGGS